MKKEVFIGIDTSNYTTSLAICSLDGKIIENYKVLLPVKEGEKGIRQSDAVFAHVKNFQIITDYIKEKHEEYDIKALGYSKYPREVDGSYMPCFLVGEAVAETVAALYNLRAYSFSHQAGHIEASIYSSGVEIDGKFIAFHVSGGTTEIVLAERSEKGFKTEIIGGSVDLHAGQAIDRIGVYMGLKFPCGKEIEALAKDNVKKLPAFKVNVIKYNCNLSGLENLSKKLFDQTNDKKLVSAFVLAFIEKNLEKITENLRLEYPCEKIIYAGGVMSNSIIQAQLKAKYESVYFATPEFSADNGAGIALLTRRKYLERG